MAIDDVEAGRLVGAHLAGLGHRDVTVVVETNRPAGSPVRRLSVQQVTAHDYAARLRGLSETVPGTVSVLSGGHNSPPREPAPRTTWSSPDRCRRRWSGSAT